MTAVTVPPVNDRRITPPRSFQLENAAWARLGDVAEQLGMKRATLVARLVLWYIRWPGVTLPRRPQLPGEAEQREAQ